MGYSSPNPVNRKEGMHHLNLDRREKSQTIPDLVFKHSQNQEKHEHMELMATVVPNLLWAHHSSRSRRQTIFATDHECLISEAMGM